MTRNVSLLTILDRLTCANVLVVGDVMLDRFIDGKVGRISPEAPIPVLAVSHETESLGAAGNVLSNLAALGCHAQLISVVGDDAAGKKIDQLVSINHSKSHLHTLSGRRTSIKSRYIASGQQLLRADEHRDRRRRCCTRSSAARSC